MSASFVPASFGLSPTPAIIFVAVLLGVAALGFLAQKYLKPQL